MDKMKDSEKLVVTLRGIDRKLFEEIRVYAIRHGSNIGPVVNEAIKKFLEQ